jgi:hypothetical protein
VITRVHLGRSMRSECAIMPRIFHLIESFFVGNVRSKKEIFFVTDYVGGLLANRLEDRG